MFSVWQTTLFGPQYYILSSEKGEGKASEFVVFLKLFIGTLSRTNQARELS